MSRSVLLTLCGLFLAGSSSGAPLPDVEARAAEQIKALIPEAASSPNADWKALAQPGAAPFVDKMKNQSLSMALLSLTGPVQGGAFVVEENIRPDKLAIAISKSQAKGYGTLLQPDFLTAYTCKVEKDRAEGTVSFKAEGLYRGKVEFTARQGKQGWRIEEFRLPGHSLRVRLQADGLWKMSKTAP